MERIAIFLISFLLSGCVGFSFLGASEGWHMNAKENTFEVPRQFESILQGYSSDNKNNPGHPVKIRVQNKSFLIKTNCLKDRAYSFSPAFIVPLPPIIPLFGIGSGSVDHNVILTVEECSEDAYVIESISSGNMIHEPISIKNCSYKFQLSCTEIPHGSITVKSKNNDRIEIKVNYINTLIYGWGWLGA